MIFFFGGARLGNQLFQYGFLSTLAKPNETIITFDMTSLPQLFSIPRKRTYFLKNNFIRIFFYTFVCPLEIFGLVRVIRESPLDFDPKSFEETYNLKKGLLPISHVDVGYFQSELFFDPQKGINDLRLKPKFVKEAQDFLDKIPSEFDKCFVHVRRGDYLVEKYFGQQDITLPPEYFEKAFVKIQSKFKKPFYIFLTDDAEYVEKTFSHLDQKIISPCSAHADFVIMTLCENGILSNSSFSWWGAYFMRNRRTVICPNYWLGYKTKNCYPPKILPSFAEVIDP